MSALPYVPMVGDLVTATLARSRGTEHLMRPGTVFEVVSVEPIRIVHTCEPPIDVELQNLAPVHPHGYLNAKLSVGMRVRTYSHDAATNGLVGYVAGPRDTMGPFRYEVCETSDFRGYLGCWRPEHLICIAPPAA